MTRASVLAAIVSLTLACSGSGDGSTGAATDSSTSAATSGEASTGASDSASGSTTSTTTTAGTDTGVCPGTCAEAPAGWEGPVVFQATDPALLLDCSPGTQEVYVGSAGFGAQDTVCDECACDDSQISCDDIVVSLYTDEQCAGTSECAQVTLSQDTCMAFPAGCNGAATKFAYDPQPDLLGGTCSPQPAVQTPELPPVQRSQAGRACRPTTADLCPGDATCTPIIPGWLGPCIYAAGDLACPAEFPFKNVLYDGHEDTRGCSECSCGDPKDPCWLTVHISSDDCTAVGGDSVGPDANKCFTAPGDQAGAEFEVFEACDPAGGEPTGELTPTGATTFCCGA